jgi:hypothetical protein
MEHMQRILIDTAIIGQDLASPAVAVTDERGWGRKLILRSFQVCDSYQTTTGPIGIATMATSGTFECMAHIML